eukprot:scaffold116578_cov17-Tisochrysis_lutea.AAC.1
MENFHLKGAISQLSAAFLSVCTQPAHYRIQVQSINVYVRSMQGHTIRNLEKTTITSLCCNWQKLLLINPSGTPVELFKPLPGL